MKTKNPIQIPMKYILHLLGSIGTTYFGSISYLVIGLVTAEHWASVVRTVSITRGIG